MWNDVEALRSIAGSLQGLADSVGAAAGDAETSDSGWVSTAADQYRSRVDTAASTLRTRSGEIASAAAAMYAYADTVEDHVGDLLALASALGMGVDYVWGRVRDGVSDVADFFESGAEDVLDSVGSAASGAYQTIRGWL